MCLVVIIYLYTFRYFLYLQLLSFKQTYIYYYTAQSFLEINVLMFQNILLLFFYNNNFVKYNLNIYIKLYIFMNNSLTNKIKTKNYTAMLFKYNFKLFIILDNKLFNVLNKKYTKIWHNSRVILLFYIICSQILSYVVKITFIFKVYNEIKFKI